MTATLALAGGHWFGVAKRSLERHRRASKPLAGPSGAAAAAMPG